MCRAADIHWHYRNDTERLKIKAFYIRLSFSKSCKCLPESLTLLFLPRIGGSPLEIDGLKIRADSPAFLTLHRAVSADSSQVTFGCRERVWAGEGIRFEVYMRAEKVLKGSFRKDEDDEWTMDCKSALESELVGGEAPEAEVFVALEGHVPMNEKVKMAVKRKKRNRGFLQGLEEIPEGREVATETDGCSCCCSCGETESGSDGGDCEEVCEEDEEKMHMEGVRWAVEVGIWVMCLGVGLLVSKASSKRLRRRRIL